MATLMKKLDQGLRTYSMNEQYFYIYFSIFEFLLSSLPLNKT